MDWSHRNRIDSCWNRIVPRIDMDKLWPKLLENGVYKRDDVNIPTWSKSLTNFDTVLDIYLNIKTRGPRAFENLLLSLRQSGHNDLAGILEGREEEPSSNTSNTETSNFPNVGEMNIESPCDSEEEEDGEEHYYAQIQCSNEPLQIKVRKSKKFLDTPCSGNVGRYVMRSKPRGLVLIIANIKFANDEMDRDSAEHDEANLKQLFVEMGFEVTTRRNLTGAQIKETAKVFAQRKDFLRIDSSFVIVTSHGDQVSEYNQKTAILGVDHERVLCNEIISYFTSENCHYLKGKPKVFFFQACRGKKAQKAVPRNATDAYHPVSKSEIRAASSSDIPTIRNFTDILVAYATIPGFDANRDTVNGSWFIQILCEVFMKYARNTHLFDLIHMIDNRLETLRKDKDKCQTVMAISMGFSKHCFLNPGLFKDSV